jgi:hypothetical protein
MRTIFSHIMRRLRPAAIAAIVFLLFVSQALAYQIKGEDVRLNASGFNGNLTATDDTVQEAIQKFDDYAGATINWDDPTVLSAVATSVGWTKGTGVVYLSTGTDNVGINSAAPTKKLDVVGTVKASRFEGDGGGLTNLPAGMVYPGAGLAKSTGINWDTSVTDNSANWNTAYGWGNHASAGYLTAEVDGSTTNEIQDLTLAVNTLSLSGDASTVDLSGYLDNTDDQTCAEVSGCVVGAITAVASDSTWTVHGSYPTGCSAGQYISAIGDTSTCGTPTDTNTTYTAAANEGLALTGTAFGLGDCAANQIWKRNAGDTAWECAADASAGGGYTNLTEFVAQTAWQIFYSDGSGDVKELALGDSGKVLTANGATSAPTWETSSGTNYWTSGAIGINTTNNVGLGSASPSQKLDVVGTVKATSFQGSGALLTGVLTSNPSLATVVGVGSTAPAVLIGTVSATTLIGALTGNASTASALAADPANCASSGLAGGINASGTAEGCVTPNAGTNIANDLEEEVTEGSLADSTIVSADIKDGTVVGTDVASPFNFPGNVGVGSATPTQKIDVVGTVKAIQFIGDGSQLTGTSGSNYWVTGAVGIGTTNSVGIGSISPAYKLEVQGNVGIGTATFNAANYLSINGNVGIGTTAQSQAFEVFGAGAFVGTGDTVFNGNVGIGSSVPGRALAVNGTMSVGIGTTVAGRALCCKTVVGTNCIVGYCSDGSCTACN